MAPGLLVLIVIAAIGASGCTKDSKDRKESAGPQPGSEIEKGLVLFMESGCLNCHVYDGLGVAALGAPELTREAERNRGLRWQIRHLRNPQAVVPHSPMPPYARIGRDNVRALAAFLEASRGQFDLEPHASPAVEG
jgi:mono/diheme cytochrome c family protein